jgi:ATP-dependent DNA ligase
LREHALEAHPWKKWADWEAAQPERSRQQFNSRWNRDKDLSWEPLRLELVAEVSYDHMEGPRFRHGTHLVRFRPDKQPTACDYQQLEVTPPLELAQILGR